MRRTLATLGLKGALAKRWVQHHGRLNLFRQRVHMAFLDQPFQLDSSDDSAAAHGTFDTAWRLDFAHITR